MRRRDTKNLTESPGHLECRSPNRRSGASLELATVPPTLRVGVRTSGGSAKLEARRYNRKPEACATTRRNAPTWRSALRSRQSDYQQQKRSWRTPLTKTLDAATAVVLKTNRRFRTSGLVRMNLQFNRRRMKNHPGKVFPCVVALAADQTDVPPELLGSWAVCDLAFKGRRPPVCPQTHTSQNASRGRIRGNGYPGCLRTEPRCDL